MHRLWSLLLLGALGLALATPALAQDVLGLSLRPTDEMPAGTARGTADIVQAEAGGYLVSVDLSAAAETMSLADFAGAAAFVVWAVDTDGMRHNLGALSGELVLEDVPVDYVVARLYVTAEPAAAAAAPEGAILFQAVLRNVEEVGAAAEPTASGAAATPTAAPAAATPTTADPGNLPTTGSFVEDILLYVAVALPLIVGGMRLRRRRA
jgi:hypothetical protein